MSSWSEEKYFAGLDWASDHHDIVLVDREGKILEQFRIPHSGEGWQTFREKLQAYPRLPVALETKHGLVVDQLASSGCRVYPVNPLSAKEYRKRKVPSGNKTDAIDAWTLAEALRTDGASWKELAAQDPLTEEIRLLCRDEANLIRQRTLLVNQLQAALREYYPAALEAFEDWTLPSTWDFVLQFPTPTRLVKAGKSAWNKFFHVHQIWRPEHVQTRIEIFGQADRFCGRAPVTSAKSQLAISLATLLRTLEAQLKTYRKRIESLFVQHPDHDLFGSLPGAGKTLSSRLLGELAQNPDSSCTPESIQCKAGTAPVSFQSGQIHKVRVRHSCDKYLRYVIHLWTDCSRKKCSWAQVYYQQKRQEGKSHACALRCLGQRWLKILWKMLQTHQPYDPQLHQKNQLEHGSWVLSLVQGKKTA